MRNSFPLFLDKIEFYHLYLLYIWNLSKIKTFFRAKKKRKGKIEIQTQFLAFSSFHESLLPTFLLLDFVEFSLVLSNFDVM